MKPQIKVKKIGFSCKGWAKDYRARAIRRNGKAAARSGKAVAQ